MNLIELKTKNNSIYLDIDNQLSTEDIMYLYEAYEEIIEDIHNTEIVAKWILELKSKFPKMNGELFLNGIDTFEMFVNNMGYPCKELKFKMLIV